MPWLRPSVASLIALTEDLPDLSTIQADPGLVLHVLRYSRPTPQPDTFTLDPLTLGQPLLCEAAAKLWELDSAARAGSDKALRFGRRAARIAQDIAIQTGLCSPHAAHAAALLAPLPWYAGQGTPSLTRRMLRRWRLPEWLATVIGYPELTTQDLVRLGAPPGLAKVVRAALQLAEPGETLRDLVYLHEPVDAEWHEFATNDQTPETGFPDVSPAHLPRLLRLAARAKARSATDRLLAAEDRIDELVASLAQARSGFELALRDAKLASLAEFAAGASHEINNPLAVIAGNVQLLKNLDPDPDYQAQLATILRQTKRIHDILHGTRQFARPTPPHRELLQAEAFLDDVRKDLEPDAESRGVTLEVHSVPAGLFGDAAQLRTAIGHLVRNAVEAAGPGGWVRLHADTAGESLQLAISDSGPGPAPEVLPHLFDPFFSGREAGRGRGLGLPIAWRLLRAHHGDVHFSPTAGRPSRFVVSLPLAPQGLKLVPSDRMSA
jgi:signal transduction histidine kinase